MELLSQEELDQFYQVQIEIDGTTKYCGVYHKDDIPSVIERWKHKYPNRNATIHSPLPTTCLPTRIAECPTQNHA